MDQVALTAAGRVTAVLAPPADELLPQLASLAQFNASTRPSPESWHILAQALRQSPQLYGVYVGYDDGNFFQVVSLEHATSAILTALAPPPGAAFRVRQIVAQPDGRRQEELTFLDGQEQVLERRPGEPDSSYDPRLRPWYGEASSGRVFTAPYLFASGSPGYTARRLLEGPAKGVVAADILLLQLQDVLRNLKITPSGGMVLFDNLGHVVAGPQLTPAGQNKLLAGQELPVVADLANPSFAAAVSAAASSSPPHLVFNLGGREYIAAFQTLDLDVQDGLRLAVVAPTDEFFADVLSLRRDAILLAVALAALAIPLLIFLSRLFSGSLRRLAAEAEERSHLILQSMEEGVCGLDMNGCVTFINPAGARMLGYEPDELGGANMHDLVHYARPDGTPYADGECPVHRSGLEGPRIVRGEVLWRKDGGSFPVELSITPVRRKGVPQGEVVAFQDVSERLRAIAEIEAAKQEAEDAQAQLAEKSQMMFTLSAKLSKYIAPQIVDFIFSGRQDVTLETKRKKLTIFYSEIKDFTLLTEGMQAEDLTELLYDYFSVMSDIALAHGATIDKFIGDQMLMFFGDPESMGVKEDAQACVQMAIAMQRRMRDFDRAWSSKGFRQPLHMSIGINTGYCNVGNFGSADRMAYSIIGAEVNLAAQLALLAEPDTIRLSYETYALVDDSVQAQELEQMAAKGIRRPVHSFSVSGIFAPDEGAPTVGYRQPGFELSFDPDALAGGEEAAARAALESALSALRGT